ncbi:MAG: CopG family transcriptional regulator [Gammaproteobacteria bacterium]|nr:MAG: CopG family transcriptional regulator [Gammaproteobacteria bacterium]
MTTTMTIRLDETLKERLNKLAATSHRTKSFLAVDAIEKYIELNEWQMQEIETALTEAQNGDFASKEQVDDVFKKWS